VGQKNAHIPPPIRRRTIVASDFLTGGETSAARATDGRGQSFAIGSGARTSITTLSSSASSMRPATLAETPDIVVRLGLRDALGFGLFRCGLGLSASLFHVCRRQRLAFFRRDSPSRVLSTTA
jgi:hypothetical protein